MLKSLKTVLITFLVSFLSVSVQAGWIGHNSDFDTQVDAAQKYKAYQRKWKVIDNDTSDTWKQDEKVKKFFEKSWWKPSLSKDDKNNQYLYYKNDHNRDRGTSKQKDAGRDLEAKMDKTYQQYKSDLVYNHLLAEKAFKLNNNSSVELDLNGTVDYSAPLPNDVDVSKFPSLDQDFIHRTIYGDANKVISKEQFKKEHQALENFTLNYKKDTWLEKSWDRLINYLAFQVFYKKK